MRIWHMKTPLFSILSFTSIGMLDVFNGVVSGVLWRYRIRIDTYWLGLRGKENDFLTARLAVTNPMGVHHYASLPENRVLQSVPPPPLLTVTTLLPPVTCTDGYAVFPLNSVTLALPKS